MAINPVQPNIDNAKAHTPYKEAQGVVKTTNNVKPLPPQGHLVHDSLSAAPKYFIKDIAYDIKALNDGLHGNANDHQLGRLNDVGLKVGGVGIATLLASKTSNPVVRVMEYAGLGAFLASMSLYPKLAINIPSRVVQGYDIGKEYIDDQGRKKSVFQDPNYIPFDMYQGEYPDEDLDVIGDKMGIPRNIKNRRELIKEQTRKIAIQNNTLWMLSAGFAAPVMSALLCCGLEKVVSPAVQSVRNSKYNSNISSMLKKTASMSENADDIKSNKLSKKVEKLLNASKDRELTKADYDKLVTLLTEDMDTTVAQGIKDDLKNIFGVNVYEKSENLADDIINTIKDNISSRNKAEMEKVFLPTKEEVQSILNRYSAKQISQEELGNIKNDFKSLFAGKFSSESSVSKEALNAYQNQIIESISKQIQKKPSRIVNENNIKDVTNFAKVLGEFKSNWKTLDKCKSFKVEHAPQTVLARTYERFENTLFDVLDIKYSDLKRMRHSEKDAQEILDKKLTELVKDDAKYQKAVEKLTKVMSNMDVVLNGKSDSESVLKDLVSSIENNYNNTAKRLNKIGRFGNTVDRLVKEDVGTLGNTIKTRQEMFNLLDGTIKDKYKDANCFGFDDAASKEYAKYNSRGVGSAKNHDIARIVERYQGANNSFNRILHLLDLYKRNIPDGAYDKSILEKGKEVVMTATSTEHTLKLNTINNPEYYRDLMRNIWDNKLEEATKNGLKVSNDLTTGNVSARFKGYIQRFRDIIGNNNIDFTKPEHILNPYEVKQYTKSEQTRISKFNLIAQSPLNLVKNAAERKYSNQKWLRIVSAVGATVFGATVLAQFGFGKIRNPHNIIRLVKNDADK